MKKVDYYYFNSVENDGTTMQQNMFDRYVELHGKMQTARYIILDILRYAYRFNKKSSILKEWRKDLEKIQSELQILELFKLNWWQRYRLRTFVFFKTKDEKDFFADYNNVFPAQVDLIEALQKIDIVTAKALITTVLENLLFYYDNRNI